MFGDIDLDEHRQWVERVCNTAGLNAVLSLWEKRREALLEAFLSSGFKAVIVGVKEVVMGAKWLGRNLDRRAAEEFQKLGIDLCGEEANTTGSSTTAQPSAGRFRLPPERSDATKATLF